MHMCVRQYMSSSIVCAFMCVHACVRMHVYLCMCSPIISRIFHSSQAPCRFAGFIISSFPSLHLLCPSCFPLHQCSLQLCLVPFSIYLLSRKVFVSIFLFSRVSWPLLSSKDLCSYFLIMPTFSSSYLCA